MKLKELQTEIDLLVKRGFGDNEAEVILRNNDSDFVEGTVNGIFVNYGSDTVVFCGEWQNQSCFTNYSDDND